MAHTKSNTQNDTKHAQHHEATYIYKKNPNFLCFSDFSSPEHEVLSELLWSFNVRRTSSIVRASVNNFFKLHLLWNRLMDFDQTSQKWCLGVPLSKFFKPFQLVAEVGHGVKNMFSKCNFQKSSCPELQGPELSYMVYSII